MGDLFQVIINCPKDIFPDKAFPNYNEPISAASQDPIYLCSRVEKPLGIMLQQPWWVYFETWVQPYSTLPGENNINLVTCPSIWFTRLFLKIFLI